MIELLSYPFMRRALLAALLTGLIAPAIGTYVVQRRLSLLGDGLGHVALLGVAVLVAKNIVRSRTGRALQAIRDRDVAAEIMGASEGLGYLLVDGQQLGRPDTIIAAIISFAVLGKLADGLLLALTRPFLAWQDLGRDKL